MFYEHCLARVKGLFKQMLRICPKLLLPNLKRSYNYRQELVMWFRVQDAVK